MFPHTFNVWLPSFSQTIRSMEPFWSESDVGNPTSALVLNPLSSCFLTFGMPCCWHNSSPIFPSIFKHTAAKILDMFPPVAVFWHRYWSKSTTKNKYWSKSTITRTTKLQFSTDSQNCSIWPRIFIKWFSTHFGESIQNTFDLVNCRKSFIAGRSSCLTSSLHTHARIYVLFLSFK